MVAPLVSTDDLAAMLEASPPRLLDVRWSLLGPPGHSAYLESHIPGAVFVDLDRDLAAPPGPGRHPLPDRDAFGAAMRRAGVRSDRTVVAYDGGDGIAAARAWWLLRHFGHTDVRVLDGGFGLWQRERRPVRAGEESVVPGDLQPGPGVMPTVDAAGAAALARDGVLLDVRSPERYRGEVEPVDRVAGHIPGARNLPITALADPHGRLLSPATLRSLLATAGADGSRPVAAYCGSGVTAARAVLALAVAGVPAALYPGSWSEWITDPERAIATGQID